MGNLLFSLLSLAILGIINYGSLPAVYLSSRFKSHLVTGAVLGIFAFVTLTVWASSEAVSSLLSFFLLNGFLLPGLLIFAGIRKGLTHVQIFYLCHLPSVLFIIYNLISPLDVEALYQVLAPVLDSISKGEANAAEITGQNLMSMKPMLVYLLPGFWYLDLSARLIVGSAILSKIKRNRKLALSIPPLRVIQYPDWTIWVVIAGLLGVFLPLYFPYFNDSLLFWASCSILIIIAPIYFLRGLSIVFHRFYKKKGSKPWPIYLKFLLVLLILWAGPTLILVFIFYGILDTWIDFRQKTSGTPTER